MGSIEINTPHADGAGIPQAVPKVGKSHLQSVVEMVLQRGQNPGELALHLLSTILFLLHGVLGDPAGGAKAGQVSLDPLHTLLGRLQICQE